MERSLGLMAGLAATALLTCTPALVHSAAGRPPQLIWNTTCKSCHFDGGVGPVVLGQDLDPEHIEQVVRRGGVQMLPFSESQISDDELEALAQWMNEQDADAP